MPEGNLFVYEKGEHAVRDLREGRLDLVVGDALPAEVAVSAGGVRISVGVGMGASVGGGVSVGTIGGACVGGGGNVGVGAAVIVGGAITGTIIPLTLDSMESLNPNEVNQLTGETGVERLLNVIIVLVGTLTALFYFRFTVRQEEAEAPLAIVAGVSVPGPLSIIKGIGKGFIAVTFGVMYAGAVAATLIVLADRVQFIWDTVTSLIG